MIPSQPDSPDSCEAISDKTVAEVQQVLPAIAEECLAIHKIAVKKLGNKDLTQCLLNDVLSRSFCGSFPVFDQMPGTMLIRDFCKCVVATTQYRRRRAYRRQPDHYRAFIVPKAVRLRNPSIPKDIKVPDGNEIPPPLFREKVRKGKDLDSNTFRYFLFHTNDPNALGQHAFKNGLTAQHDLICSDLVQHLREWSDDLPLPQRVMLSNLLSDSPSSQKAIAAGLKMPESTICTQAARLRRWCLKALTTGQRPPVDIHMTASSTMTECGIQFAVNVLW